MSRRSRFTTTLKRPLDNLREGVATWRAERTRKKRECRWKRKKERVGGVHDYCVRQLYEQLWDEYLQVVMIAKLRDVKLPSIGESRMHWLHSAGVHTAYDVQRKGANGLNEIYSIGPTLALSLVEWAKTYIPANLPVDTSSRDYIQRLRVLKRK